MIDYGRVKSAVRPPLLEIQGDNVIISSNIVEGEEVIQGATYPLYEYDQKVYDKDEYLSIFPASVLEEIQELQEEFLALKIALGVT